MGAAMPARINNLFRDSGTSATIAPSMFEFVGWIFFGFLAGSLSGWFVGTRSVKGCLPTIVVGIVGGIVGGWLARELGFGQVEGFFGSLLFAILGGVVVRLVLKALEGGR